MTNIFFLLKSYIISSILWFIFMLTIISIRLINDENINDVFGVSLVDITLYIFLTITVIFVSVLVSFNKIYIHRNKFYMV